MRLYEVDLGSARDVLAVMQGLADKEGQESKLPFPVVLNILKPFGLGITKENSDSYKAKYGTDNWYDWAIANWGSKWGVYDETEWNITDVEEDGLSSAGIWYQTAWTPVSLAWERISKNYPTLEFFHEFADEGGAFVGNQLIQDGNIIDDNDYEWNSDEGIVIREGVGMLVEEEEV